MSSVELVTRPRAVKRQGSRRPTDGWWGDGPPPTDRWPGVTISFDATWVPLVGHRRVRATLEDGSEAVVWVNHHDEVIPDWYGEAGGCWQTHDGKYYFDQDAADRACDFFPTYLRHHIGEFAGLPFHLLDYQRLLLTRPIFGWCRVSDGMRRIRKVFAFLPKGAGKSPWGAGTGLYLAVCDGEPAAEVYAVAADKKQARTVHDNAKVMVEESPDLNDMLEVQKDSIFDPESRSTYQVLSSDASTKHGFRPHGVVFDEMHAQRNRDLYEALKKSMVKRRQPLMLIITHSGHDDEGICFEEYEYAKAVLAGRSTDESCLPVIFEIQKGEDWKDPKVWARVNPGHGITVKADGLAIECQEAIAEPRKQNDFKRFHLNAWTNQATAWITIEDFDACEAELDDRELVLLDVAAGLDLAQKWDLAALVLVFRKYLPTSPDSDAPSVDVVDEAEDGNVTKRSIAINYRLMVRPFFWIPEGTMRKHEREDGVPYSLWEKAGLVTATEGDIIDYNRIYLDITTKILPRFPKLLSSAIGYDPAFATDLASKLRLGKNLNMVEVLQNYKMLSEPSQVIEALIRGKRFSHAAHRLYRWNWENVAVKTDDAGRIRPVKPKRQSKRIDGAVATIMGQKALDLLPRPREFQMLFAGGRK